MIPMPGRNPRDAASDELERLRTSMMTLAAAAADAVQLQTESTAQLADGLLDPSKPLVASVRGLVALWIDAMRRPLDMCRQICQIMNDPSDATGPRGAVAGGQVRFVVPVGSEATDPVPLDVPVDQVGAIQVLGSRGGVLLPPANIYVSVSSSGVQVQVALIELDSVQQFQQLGSQCGARLTLPDGRTLDIVATRT
jgi:hypothetical protein